MITLSSLAQFHQLTMPGRVLKESAITAMLPDLHSLRNSVENVSSLLPSMMLNLLAARTMAIRQKIRTVQGMSLMMQNSVTTDLFKHPFSNSLIIHKENTKEINVY